MPESNGRQADVPVGATPIPQQLGTAPGLICPVGHKVVYALPGVPYELTEMFTRGVLPDLRQRAEAAGETPAVIASRVVRTWGMSESGLAEVLAPRIDALDAAGGNPTIAFLASGIEGIKVRITAKAPATAADSAVGLLDAEEAEVRALVGEVVFGVDDDTMETAVAGMLAERGLTLGLAESLTGGLVASRLVGVPGAQDWFRGSRRQLRLGGEVHRAGPARGPGGERAGGACHGRRRPSGARRRRRPRSHRRGRTRQPGGRCPRDRVRGPRLARAHHRVARVPPSR